MGKTDVITVPKDIKDRCLFKWVEKIEDLLSDSWIFLHGNLYQHLVEIGEDFPIGQGILIQTDSYHLISLRFEETHNHDEWTKIISITDGGRPCKKTSPTNPKNIYFFKMEE